MAKDGRLTIQPWERVAAVGKTQSGKTHVMGLLALPLKRLIVIDPKGLLSNLARSASGKYSWHLTEWHSAEGRKVREQMSAGGPGRLRCPFPLEGDYEPVFRFAYGLRNVTVYIDEMYGVEEGTKPGTWLRALYTRGAEHKIGVWAATQRPREIPKIMLTEAEWRFLFTLTDPDDLRFMRRQMGGHEPTETMVPERSFWLYNLSWLRPRYYPDGVTTNRRIA